MQTKTPKECYLRAKLLKLKNKSLDEAKLISARLISNQAQTLKDERIGHALDRLCQQLKKRDPLLNVEEVRQMCDYVKTIQQEYSEFKKLEEDALLFGREVDYLAIKEQEPCMRIVPVAKGEFRLLSNQHFVAFLATFGI